MSSCGGPLNSLRGLSGLILVAAIFVTLPAYGLKEFYSITRSPKALGMGGAFYGLSNDEHALFYNPAGLAFYEGGKDLMGQMKFDGSLSIITAVQKMMEGSNKSVSQLVTDLETFQGAPISGDVTPFLGYYLRKHFAMGLLIADTKVNFALLGKDLDTSVDLTAISDSGVFFGFGIPIGETGLAFGANIKGIFRAGGRKTYTVLEIAQGSGFQFDIKQLGGAGGGIDFDLGVTYQLPEIIPSVVMRGSVVVNNVMASRLDLFRVDDSIAAPPGLPRMLTIAGLMQLPGFWWFDRFNLLLDLAEFGLGGQADPEFGARTGSLWKHVNFGIEVPVWGWGFGRMGFRQGNFTIGAGFDARFFQMDIATYAEELATLPGRLTSRRVALRLAAGFGGSSKPEVEPATETTVPPPEEKKPEEPKPEEPKVEPPPPPPPEPVKPEPPKPKPVRQPQSLKKPKIVPKPRPNVDRFNVDQAVKESY